MRGWLFVAFLCVSGCSGVSPGNQGARAYRAGRYEEAYRLWKPLADKKDVRAQCQLAYLYERGLGVKQDLAQATAWYEKAALQGSSYAENSLGQLYARDQPDKSLLYHLRAAGQGQLGSQLAAAELLAKKRDFKGAVEWYQKAAAQKSPAAMLALARSYHEGKGIARDPKQALAWANKAAEDNNPEALCVLGQMMQSKEPRSAASFYRKAADLGSAEGQFRLALLSQGQETRTLLLKAAEQDYAPAQLALAKILLKEQDSYRAQDWLTRAANQGSGEAAFELGKLEVDDAGRQKWYSQAYEHGSRPAGVELGKIYARRGAVTAEQEACLALAGEDGDVKAQYVLGEMLQREGQRDREAVAWFQKAAAQKHGSAFYSLGRMIEDGRGYRQDDRLALQYYSQAALAQVPEAFYAMGRMKQKLGDYKEALLWYQRAAEAGISDGYFAMGLLYEEGEGVPKDTSRAEEYYLWADIPVAYYALGRLYEIRKDPAQALEYYVKAGDLPEAVQARERLQS